MNILIHERTETGTLFHASFKKLAEAMTYIGTLAPDYSQSLDYNYESGELVVFCYNLNDVRIFILTEDSSMFVWVLSVSDEGDTTVRNVYSSEKAAKNKMEQIKAEHLKRDPSCVINSKDWYKINIYWDELWYNIDKLEVEG